MERAMVCVVVFVQHSMALGSQTNIPIKQLTHMMLNGQNDLVLAYLRSLPKDECNKTRTKFVFNESPRLTL